MPSRGWKIKLKIGFGRVDLGGLGDFKSEVWKRYECEDIAIYNPAIASLYDFRNLFQRPPRLQVYRAAAGSLVGFSCAYAVLLVEPVQLGIF